MSTARKNALVERDWLLVATAQKLLGMKSHYQVFVLAISGELKAKYEKMGNRVYISRESVEQYLAKQVEESVVAAAGSV